MLTRGQIEQSLLGSVLLDGKAYEALDGFQDDHFTPEAAVVFRALRRLELGEFISPGRPIDLTQLAAETDAGQSARAVKFAMLAQVSVPTAAHAGYYADLLWRWLEQQAIVQAAEEAIRLHRAGELDQEATIAFRAKVAGIEQSARQTPVYSGMELAERVRDIYETARLRGPEASLPGLPTGLKDLDDALGGLRPKHLVVIGARPSMGKTALAIRIALHAAIELARNVLMLSLEMPRDDMALRAAAIQAQVPHWPIERGQLDDPGIDAVVRACGQLGDSGVRLVEASGMNIRDLRAMARRIHFASPLSLIVVDYLQLIQGQDDLRAREASVAQISRGLKNLAMELDVPVVALSQLNRDLEKRQNKRPVLADLRESGAIEQDADEVLFLYRDSVYSDSARKDEAELEVAKNRNGSLKTLRFRWEGRTMRFSDWESAPGWLT